MKYSNDALRRLLGPMGALKRKIEDETGWFLCYMLCNKSLIQVCEGMQILQTIEPSQLVVMVLIMCLDSYLVDLSCRISLLYQGDFLCIVGLVKSI